MTSPFDLQEVLRASALSKRAKASGVDTQLYIGKLDELEAAIEIREAQLSADLGWEGVSQGWKERRLMVSAAYVAGASLRQLGRMLGITAPSVKELVIKELPREIVIKVGTERTGKGRAFSDEQVNAMISWWKENRVDAVGAAILITAAKMRQVAISARDE